MWVQPRINPRRAGLAIIPSSLVWLTCIDFTIRRPTVGSGQSKMLNSEGMLMWDLSREFGDEKLWRGFFTGTPAWQIPVRVHMVRPPPRASLQSDTKSAPLTHHSLHHYKKFIPNSKIFCCHHHLITQPTSHLDPIVACCRYQIQITESLLVWSPRGEWL